MGVEIALRGAKGVRKKSSRPIGAKFGMLAARQWPPLGLPPNMDFLVDSQIAIEKLIRFSHG